MENKLIEIEEVCSQCDGLIKANWNLKEHGYVMYCPFCGTKVYLCNQCEFCSEGNCNDNVCPAKIQELIKTIDKNIVGVDNESVYLNGSITLIENLNSADENTPLYIANCNIEMFIDDILERPLDCNCEFVSELYTKYCIETKRTMTTKIENHFPNSTLGIDDINNIIFNFLMSQNGESFDSYLIEKENYLISVYM